MPPEAIASRLRRAIASGRRVARRRMPAKQCLDRHRLGELGGTAPAAVDVVEGGVERRRRLPQDLHVRQAVHGRTGGLRLRERVDESGTRPLDLLALVRPASPDRLQDLAERRHPVTGRVREVRAAVERAPVGSQEHAHRPAALPGQRLDGAHVDLVQVRALLPVHLDRDEMGVEDLGRRLVLERLPLHHVAPVAGRVSDGQEDRTIQQARPCERLRRPTDTSPRGWRRAGAGRG